MGFFKRSTFIPHPEGVVGAVLVDSQADNGGKFGAQIRLAFDTEELMESDGRPYRVSYWIGEAFNPRSNSYKFFKAAGVDVDSLTDEQIEALDPDDYLNQRFQLVIEHKKSAEGQIQAKIVSMLPGKKKRTAPPPVVTPPAPPARSPVPVGAAAGADAGLWSEEDE